MVRPPERGLARSSGPRRRDGRSTGGRLAKSGQGDQTGPRLLAARPPGTDPPGEADDRHKARRGHVLPELRVTERVVIPGEELSCSFARSGGPGGQNVNKVASK